MKKIIKLLYVPTNEMYADILTKATDKTIFMKCREYLFNAQ